MASVTSKDIPLEFQMFGELVNLRKEFYIPEDSDEYWVKVVASFDALYEKYPTDYCRDLVLATVKDLESKYRKLKTAKKGSGDYEQSRTQTG